MEPIKLQFHEFITASVIIVSVTTAYVLLSADVKSLKEEVVKLSISVDDIQDEQYKVRYLLNVKEGLGLSLRDEEVLRQELAKKHWRKK